MGVYVAKRDNLSYMHRTHERNVKRDNKKQRLIQKQPKIVFVAKKTIIFGVIRFDCPLEEVDLVGVLVSIPMPGGRQWCRINNLDKLLSKRFLLCLT